nr:alkane hydroxylase MAH1-like [Tanacetum cinerariifolium]
MVVGPDVNNENVAPVDGVAPVVDAVDYVLSENLEAFSDPDVKIQSLMEGLESKDWLMVCESLNDVRRFALFHSALLLPILEKVMMVLVKSMKNPRMVVHSCSKATMDPLDKHHIVSKNFKNYPKGENFHTIIDVMGKGILTSAGEIWAMNHKVVMHVLNHAEFQTTLETIVWNKLESGLLPILESVSGNGVEVDLQDIFQRFTFDTICKLLFDNDPKSLCLDFPFAPCVKALRDAEEALLLRHITPPSLWKLQQLLRVGKENKLIVESIRLDEQNEIRIWPKKKQRYGYHDRSS